MYTFKSPLQPYRRCILPFTVFEIVVQLLNMVTELVLSDSAGASLKLLRLLRLVTVIYFGYVIYVMARVKRENRDLQPPYELYALC